MVGTIFSAACGILSAFFKLAATETVCDAVCVDSAFRGSFNVEGQTPCQVADALNGQFSVFIQRRLSEALFHCGTSPRYATPYVCNEFYHSLLAVCALCQGESASNCPEWNAKRTVDALTTETNSVSETITYLTMSGAPAASDTLPTPTSPTSKASTLTAAIAGGVIGGVVFSCMVGCVLIAFLIRRRQRRGLSSAPSAVYKKYAEATATPATPLSSGYPSMPTSVTGREGYSSMPFPPVALIQTLETEKNTWPYPLTYSQLSTLQDSRSSALRPLPTPPTTLLTKPSRSQKHPWIATPPLKPLRREPSITLCLPPGAFIPNQDS